YKNYINQFFLFSRNGTAEYPAPQLTFHHVHGTNIHLLRNSRVAKRKESFCKGLAFSSRPIRVDENVCIRFAEVVTNWSGVLRFGVTNVDPASFRGTDLPKFACPDLTSKDGYWAKALPERYSVEGSILHFYVNTEGELYYGINGILKGQFLNGINVYLPMWVIVDIYGNTSALEFVDPSDLRRFRFGGKTRSHRNSLSALTSTQQASSSSVSSPRVTFSPLTFHTVRGKHISLSKNYTIAERYAHEFACGYVFSSRPLQFNEKLVIQVLEMAYSGGLAFGLTCCDPKNIQGSTLPVDSDDLLERSEYWVGIKDVAGMPKVTDELAFWITKKGEVYFSKNNLPPRVIIHVDTAVDLWAFFDVYGTTMKIRLLGLFFSLAFMIAFIFIYSFIVIIVNNFEFYFIIFPVFKSPNKKSEEIEAEIGDECRICMNAKVNCVIYTCGHMSMCYECATETWHVNGECPICRKKIEDVIKIYKA
ncbi:unnamed protein product, partial [Dracunculus medinensis]|uniref:RING-type domain-containing protein n=1 Tax=Dracunculus medinensis TaxID=318479 RepID=A0A158Q4M9_DRAME